jgi:hypothetical protein
MKRYIDKEQSPRYQIDKTTVTEHFAKIWVKLETEFKEAERGTPFALEPRDTGK